MNIGASTTGLVVYEEGDILHTAVMPIGSDHHLRLAIGLRTSIDVAEQVKLRYATCLSEDISKKDEINLGELGAPEDEFVGRVCDITEARVLVLNMLIVNCKSRSFRMLPAGVFT